MLHVVQYSTQNKISMLAVDRNDSVLMVKDVIVIYRLYETSLILISLKLYFRILKINT